MAAMLSTLGSSLNNTPPPPFTCVSMKPGHQQAAVEIDGAIGPDDLARADDCFDAAVAHQQRLAALDAGVGEHPSIAECEQHQTVSVTLLRCGGRSGSRPRASASSFAMR